MHYRDFIRQTTKSTCTTNSHRLSLPRRRRRLLPDVRRSRRRRKSRGHRRWTRVVYGSSGEKTAVECSASESVRKEFRD